MSKKIDTAIAHLATIIAQEASASDVDLADRVDAFKALTAYGIGVAKIKAKDPEETDAPSFDKFAKKLAAVK